MPTSYSIEGTHIFIFHASSSFSPSLAKVVERYPYVAMDTEFPGVVARPVGDVTAADYQYKTLKCNVDLLKVKEGGRTGE